MATTNMQKFSDYTDLSYNALTTLLQIKNLSISLGKGRPFIQHLPRAEVTDRESLCMATLPTVHSLFIRGITMHKQTTALPSLQGTLPNK